jgi:23S rRNA (adenine2503-C2)-methyltransferase
VIDTVQERFSVKQALTGLFPKEIAAELGLKPFQGDQIFRWIHQKQVFDFDAMTNLSKGLRERLKENYDAVPLTLEEVSESEETGTRKILFRLRDGESVEAVLLRSRDRLTVCLSTQVGCAVKCTFCATGLSGFTRDLDAAEVVGQALYLLRDVPLEGRTPNIVFMGMGEPLRNYDTTVQSIKLLMDKAGLGIGARKITVSTAGEVPGIAKFAQEDWQVRLSISLHAANDAKRSALVPLNRKYPLARLMEAVHAYVGQIGRQVTFEWTLLKGVNDSEEDARELVKLVQDLKACVNLIPYNPVKGISFATPDAAACEAFADYLNANGVTATLRMERGRDIDAACGQLRRRVAARSEIQLPTSASSET